jgi:DME family drug/metabolite transporter
VLSKFHTCEICKSLLYMTQTNITPFADVSSLAWAGAVNGIRHGMISIFNASNYSFTSGRRDGSVQSTGSVPKHISLVLLAGILYGTAGTAAALGPTSATPLAIGGLRLMAGALILFLILPLIGASWRRLPQLFRRPTIWVMALGAAAYQPFFFTAVERSGVALSTLVAVGAGPIFAGILGWVILKQRPTSLWIGATGLAIFGLLLRSWGEVDFGESLGLVLALGAGLSSAAYVVAAKVELNRGGHFVEMPTAAYLIGSVMLLPFVLTQPLGWVGTFSGAALIIYLGVVTMAIANVSQVRGMKGMPPGPAATLLLADPLTATILGMLVLNESITGRGVIGMILVLVALLLQGKALGNKPNKEPIPQPVL